MRVFVRPIGSDMAEVGGSSSPRPAKIKNPVHAGALIAGGQHTRSVTPSSCLCYGIRGPTEAHRQPPNKTSECQIQCLDRALPQGAKQPN